MASIETTTPPAGGNPEIIHGVVELEPSLMAFVVTVDHEHGLVAISPARWQRCRLLLGAESALQLAAALVAGCRDLGPPRLPRP